MSVFTEGLSQQEGLGRHYNVSVLTLIQEMDMVTGETAIINGLVQGFLPGNTAYNAIMGEFGDAFVKVVEDADGSQATITVINLPPRTIMRDPHPNVSRLSALSTPDNTYTITRADDSYSLQREGVDQAGRRKISTLVITHIPNKTASS